MTVSDILFTLALFQIKHLIADFVLQSPFQVTNKGQYGHPGGILHAGIQVGLTLPILLWVGLGWPAIVSVMVVEFLVHYHLDWSKEFLSRRYALTTSMAAYWWLFGTDQALHQLTYIGIVWWWMA